MNNPARIPPALLAPQPKFLALYTDPDCALLVIFANRDEQARRDAEDTRVNLKNMGMGVHWRSYDSLATIPEALALGLPLDNEAAHMPDLTGEWTGATIQPMTDPITDPAEVLEMEQANAGGEPVLSAATVAAIHECLQMLAGNCDGARTLDGAGFNKFDTEFGRKLAHASGLSLAQARAGRKLVRKYQRQLPADLYATALGVAPEHLDTDETNGVQTPAFETRQTPAELVNLKYHNLATGEPRSGDDVAGNGCEEYYGDTYQNGVTPGPHKMAQFLEIFEVTKTPRLYGQEKDPVKIAHVKLFAGPFTWYLTEFSAVAPDGAANLAFGMVTGMGEDGEQGYIDIAELAASPGPSGSGIEIDMHFRPTPLAEIQAQLNHH